MDQVPFTPSVVAITGGTIDGTPIGGSTPAAGAFTTLTASSTLDVGGFTTLQSAANATAVVVIGSLNALAGVTQIGIYSNLTGTTAGTSAIRGNQVDIRTPASAYTVTNAVGFQCGTGSLGAGSAITRFTCFHATRGTTASYSASFHHSNSAAPNFVAGDWFLYNDSAHSSYLGTGATLINTTTDDGVNKLQVAGGATFTGAIATTVATVSTSTTTGALVVAGGIGVAGQITFDGGSGLSLRVTNGVANAAVVTVMSAVGPTGSQTTIQGWLRISVAGTDRFIPFW